MNWRQRDRLKQRLMWWMWAVLSVVAVVMIGYPAFAQLDNHPPTSPPEVAKIYQQGKLINEAVCRFDRVSSFVCDFVLMPNGTGRMVMFDNNNQPIRVYLIAPDGGMRLLWRRIEI